VKRNPRAQLWHGIVSYGTTIIGRTEWTIGGYSWMVRSRVLGDNFPDREVTPRGAKMSNDAGRRTVALYTAEAKQGRLSHGATAHRYNGDATPVHVAHTHWQDASRSTVRVPVNPRWALGMDTLIAEHTDGKYEVRVNPWSVSVSWWTLGANAYPLAILLGIHGVRLSFPEATS
jgi:hypothetical protein